MEQLDVDAEVAAILVQEGFTTVEEVAYVAIAELIDIDEFDEDIADELQGRARDALLTQAIAAEEKLEVNEPQEDLLGLEGMTTELAYELAARGTCTQEDLAELSIDDFDDIEGVDEEMAGKLIMAARAPWFEDASHGE